MHMASSPPPQMYTPVEPNNLDNFEPMTYIFLWQIKPFFSLFENFNTRRNKSLPNLKKIV